jgi:predicted small secreted protein
MIRKYAIPIILGSMLLAGCPNDGAMEEAGETIDEAAEDVEEAVDDAVDDNN